MKHSKAFRRWLNLPWQCVWVAIPRDFNLSFLFQKLSKQNKTTDWRRTRAGDFMWAGLELCSATRPAVALWRGHLQLVWVLVNHLQLAAQTSAVFYGTVPSLFPRWLWHFICPESGMSPATRQSPSHLFTWINGLVCVKARQYSANGS